MKRKLAWAIVIAGLLVLGVDAACALVNMTVGHQPMPAVVGNRGRWLHSPLPVKHRVGVLGDAQKGLANLTNIVRAVKAEGVQFMIQTGDLVSTNDEGHYRLAARALEEASPAVPIFVVPGNHDLKDGPERFEREIGSIEHRFLAGRILYVILNNASGAPPDLARLEGIVRSGDPAHGLVLAMHVPPFDARGEVQRGYEPFLAWLEKSPVQYLLCGHAHGYFRKRVGQTTVIVNGVGGDYDKWQLDQKVYATILDIDGTRITDRSIELPPEHGLRENIEHLAVGHVVEAYRRQPFLVWGSTILVAGAVGISIGMLRLNGRITPARASVVS